MFAKFGSQTFQKEHLTFEQRIDQEAEEGFPRTTTLRLLGRLEEQICLAGTLIKGFNGSFILVQQEGPDVRYKAEKIQTVFSRMPQKDLLDDILFYLLK